MRRYRWAGVAPGQEGTMTLRRLLGVGLIMALAAVLLTNIALGVFALTAVGVFTLLVSRDHWPTW
jgi:hypothetical protein